MVNENVRFNIAEVPTAELVQELAKREAVDFHTVAPYKDFSVTVNGPVVLLVVWD